MCYKVCASILRYYIARKVMKDQFEIATSHVCRNRSRDPRLTQQMENTAARALMYLRVVDLAPCLLCKIIKHFDDNWPIARPKRFLHCLK
jgi:hypothetical protein